DVTELMTGGHEGEYQEGIPSFLRRDESNQPVFATQVNDEGQTELIVEEGGPYGSDNETEREMSSDDVAMSVLDQLEDQITSQGSEPELVGAAEGCDESEGEYQGAQEYDESEGGYQEAPVPIALAELERAVQEGAA